MKFLYLVIKGKNLNLENICMQTNLNIKVYRKDDKIESRFLKKDAYQKEDRVVYAKEAQDNYSTRKFLNDFLDILSSQHWLMDLTKHNNGYVELVIYENSEKTKFSFTLSRKNMRVLSKLNLKFSITFVDF